MGAFINPNSGFPDKKIRTERWVLISLISDE